MFNPLHLQVNRGTFNSQATGGSFVSTNHSYKSDSDTLTQIITPGYFPANFGVDLGIIQNKDTLAIVGSDTFSTAEIINAVTGSVIIPAADFPGGIIADDYNGTTTTSTMRFGPNQTVPVQIGNTNSPGIFPGGVITNSIAAESPSDIIEIGVNNTVPISIGQVGAEIVAGGGVRWVSGVGGIITSYQEETGTAAFSGPWASIINIPFTVRGINDTIIFTAKYILAAPSINNTYIQCPAATVPAWAFPSTVKFQVLYTVNNSLPVVGLMSINVDGSIVIAATLADANFAATGDAGSGNLSMTYDVND